MESSLLGEAGGLCEPISQKRDRGHPVRVKGCDRRGHAVAGGGAISLRS
jgi:hypothetical protein